MFHLCYLYIPLNLISNFKRNVRLIVHLDVILNDPLII